MNRKCGDWKLVLGSVWARGGSLPALLGVDVRSLQCPGGDENVSPVLEAQLCHPELIPRNKTLAPRASVYSSVQWRVIIPTSKDCYEGSKR